MKKRLCAWLALCMAGCLFVSCTDSAAQSSGSLEEESSFSSEYSSEYSSENSSEESSAEKPSESGKDTEKYEYTDFTAADKALFTKCGLDLIPFIPNNEYYAEEYYDEYVYDYGVNFYTAGNTKAEFDAYRAQFVAMGYVLSGTEKDSYGDTWYYYDKGDTFVDMAYYLEDGESWVDVYVYPVSNNDGQGGNVGGETEYDILTNAGKGLPSGKNGVYEVDFTKAAYVKNVTEQGYYLDGCPTVSGDKPISVLVIPVEFSDVTAASKGYSLSTLDKAFNGEAGETDSYSVSEYYRISSYGKLELDFVLPSAWFMPKYTSGYYKNQTTEYDGEEVAIGDQMVMDEALAYFSKSMDLTKFDSDGNGYIDAVILINTLDINDESDFEWAYRYWNIYTDDNGDYYEYDGVCANDYLWASYQFLHETEDKNGNLQYTDKNAVNTYTYIHEFGHVLGADDYYDTAYVGAPLEGYDVMDSMLGDHNAFTKFNYGWLTKSRLVVAEESVTLTLEDFSQNGDTILIANNFDETLGAYQEYFLLVYYTNNGLNSGEYGYFEEEGILVYHVNASLYKEIYEGETYYDIYNTNTDVSDEYYGAEDNLIELIKADDYGYTFGVGDSLSKTVRDDNGQAVSYVFKVDGLTGTTATLTFYKNK